MPTGGPENSRAEVTACPPKDMPVTAAIAAARQRSRAVSSASKISTFAEAERASLMRRMKCMGTVRDAVNRPAHCALAAHIGKGMRAAEGAILKTLSPQLSDDFWAVCRAREVLNLYVVSVVWLVGAERFELSTPSPPDCVRHAPPIRSLGASTVHPLMRCRLTSGPNPWLLYGSIKLHDTLASLRACVHSWAMWHAIVWSR